MGSRNKYSILDKKYLLTMNTKRLLSHRKSLNRAYSISGWCSDDGHNVLTCKCESCSIERNRQKEIEDQIKDVKEILSSREHIN